MNDMDILSLAVYGQVERTSVSETDRTFFLDSWDDPGRKNLENDIRENGLLQPLRLQETSVPGCLRLVDGFKRFAVLSALGADKFPALIFPADADTAALFRARLAARPHALNAVQASRLLRRLESSGAFREEEIPALLRSAGLGSSPDSLSQLRKLERLEEPLSRWCEENDAGLAEASSLATFPRESQRGILVLLRAVNPGGNLLRRYLALIREIALREAKPAEEVLADKTIRSVILDPQTAKSAGRELVHRRLRELRYPETTALMEKFSQATKDLELPAGFEISAPEAFEGESLRIGFRFRSPGELAECAAALDRASRSEALRRMFACFGEPPENDGPGGDGPG